MVGPSSISMGRGDYNDAINKTQDEQLLMAIVKGRYGDTFSLLSVTGVAANLVELARSSCDLAERWPGQTDSTRGQTRRGRAPRPRLDPRLVPRRP